MSKRYKFKRRARYYRERNWFEENPPCWCGAKNPYYAPLTETCGGFGYAECFCGGDLCVCHNHGELECFGCPDCWENEDYEDDYAETEN